jgi:3-oxoacyl-[acyl-carrier protein] reductase
VTATAAKSDRSFEELMAERETGIPAGRFGRAEELGDACAYLCSTQAGYITGQNILLDGGSYGGTL